MAEKPELKYFEVAFSNSGSADDENATWICIRGTGEPTVAEAQRFLEGDSKRIGAPVVGVFPIDEQTARGSYDFEHEADWPVFSRDGEDTGFYDDAGGYHDAGCGWDPNGNFCGECSCGDCGQCPIWAHDTTPGGEVNG